MAKSTSEFAYSRALEFGPASHGSRWKRRIFSIPTVLGATLLLTVASPALVIVAPLTDLLSFGRLSATRTLFFFLAFLWAETIGLMFAALYWFTPRGPAYTARHYRLQRRWAEFLFAAAVRIFDVDVELKGDDDLETSGGSLFLVRHASTMDTVLPFVVDRRRTFRYVLKEELLFDPCLDVFGHRLPNCFVQRGSDRKESEVRRVAALARDVGDDEAVVIFPEGTRYTPAKRQRLLRRMEEKNHPALGLARELQSTLSPLRAGALALGRASRDLDVVFLAHHGIESAGSLGDLLRGGLTHARLRIRVWRVPASEVPRDEGDFSAFLADQWRQMDRWIRN